VSKNILYIGNKLSTQARSVTSIETLGKLLASENLNLKFVSSKRNQISRLFDMCFTLVKLNKWANYVLIDTYSTSAFWYAYFSGLLCRFFKIPYVPILRGGNLPNRLKNSPKLCSQLFSNAYVNIAPSDYLLEAFKEKGYINVQHIPNTIEIEKYVFQHIKKANPKLLYVRSFAYIYNPILALRVVKELQIDFPEIELSMIGPFKDKSIEDCKAYAEKHNLPVKFTGKMQKEEWIEYAKDFDIFINTTNVDNTPVSVIEAMALGLPVVSTNVGGLPYLLKEDEAILVPPNDVQAMKKAIQKLIESPTLVEKLSLNGRKKAGSFDWNIVKYKWLEVLHL
jgi:glycosyltransferase involved in cell wall biosynthesis